MVPVETAPSEEAEVRTDRLHEAIRVKFEHQGDRTPTRTLPEVPSAAQEVMEETSCQTGDERHNAGEPVLSMETRTQPGSAPLNDSAIERRWRREVMRKAHVVSLLLLLFSLSAWAQSSGPSVYLTSKSKTDTPAKPNQASSEAAAAASYLEDRIAISLQNQYPCAKVTEDKDLIASLEWARLRQLLGSDVDLDLEKLAGAVGAQYLIVANATQSGGTEYLKVSCMDTVTGKIVAMQDKASGGKKTVSDAESLAQSFAGSLGGLFAVKPQAGTSYRAGVIMQLVCKPPVTGNWEEATWSDYQQAKESGGYWNDLVGPSACQQRPQVKQLVEPGRYRLVACHGKCDNCERHEIGAEFTVAGSCQK